MRIILFRACPIVVIAIAVTFWAFAQSQTQPGYVYVLSNAGSFGDGIYKVGFTQRDQPLSRVQELGDTSVPFPFDVHALIYTDDPRGLERKIHADLDQYRVNKVNTKKEFFRVDLNVIVNSIATHHGQPFDVVVEAKAEQYRKSMLFQEKQKPDKNSENVQSKLDSLFVQSQETNVAPATAKFILNTQTNKVHFSHCRTIQQGGEHFVPVLTINWYDPCKVCNPQMLP